MFSYTRSSYTIITPLGQIDCLSLCCGDCVANKEQTCYTHTTCQHSQYYNIRLVIHICLILEMNWWHLIEHHHNIQEKAKASITCTNVLYCRYTLYLVYNNCKICIAALWAMGRCAAAAVNSTHPRPTHTYKQERNFLPSNLVYIMIHLQNT